MGLKNFDFKQFMLQKGEVVGITTGLVAMAVMLGFGGYWGFTSNQPTATAAIIDTESTRIENALKTQKPNPKLGIIDPDLLNKKSNDFFVRTDYLATRDFFTTSTLEDSKRQQVEVLPPEAFTTNVLLAPVRSLIISTQKDETMVMVITDSNTKPTENKAMATFVKNRGTQMTSLLRPNYGAMGPGMAPGMGGPRPGPGMTPPAMGAPALGGASGLNPQMQQDPRIVKYLEELRKKVLRPGVLDFQSPPAGKKSQMVKWDEKLANAKFAETIQPYRMIIVSADFPYRKQLERFQIALRQQNLNTLLSDPNAPIEFQGFDVQRVLLAAPSGPIAADKQQWLDINLENDFKPVLLTAVDYEKEDEELQPVEVRGLYTPRPVLREMKYPRCELPGVTSTLREFRERGRDATSAVSQQNKFSNRIPGLFESGEVAGATPTAGGPRPIMPTPMPNPNIPGGATAAGAVQPDLWVPEFCLVRFIDVDVKPGNTYAYRLRIKMLNPNYEKKDLVAFASLAEQRQLYSEWSAKTPPVKVPDELYYYALDQAALDKVGFKDDTDQAVPSPEASRDKTYVQVQRWLLEERINPAQDNTYPIGNWSIAERIPAYRGEYIGKPTYVELPVWNHDWEAFILPNTASKARAGQRGQRGVPIDFNSRAILVDFEGGKGTFSLGSGVKTKTVNDESPVEVLLLTPDGHLEVRNTREDSLDRDRLTRHKNWVAWINQVKNDVERLLTGGSAAGTDAPLFGKPK